MTDYEFCDGLWVLRRFDAGDVLELLRGRNPQTRGYGRPKAGRRVSRTTSDENMAHGRTSHATHWYAASPQIGHLRVTGGTETGATTLRRVADWRSLLGT